MNKVSVQCRNIRLAYGKTEVLKDVSLAIEPGEFFALLGPSGSGKSTLLRLIAGFNQHQQGELLVDGRDVSGLPPWQRNIGMVFQNYALWPHMTVWDNVAFGLVERKVNKASLRKRVEGALELVGLAHLGQRRPNQLSGGQQQRVALARTIVIEPQVLLLDEPLSNLDKTLRVQMRQELLALQRRLGITTLFVTHDQEEAMSTADRMAVLDHGVVQQVGSPATLYDRPVNAFVAGFVGTMNFLPGRMGEDKTAASTVTVEGVGDFELPRREGMSGNAEDAALAVLPTAGAVLLSFRPHAVRLARPEEASDPRCIWMSGTVEAAEFLGEFTRYRVRVGPYSLAADRAHRAESDSLRGGAAVKLGVDLKELRFFIA